MFYRRCFLFFIFSPRCLRDPSTDRPETLPHDQNLAIFYKLTSKFRGCSPKKWRPKTCKISVNFWPLQTLIANICGARQHIRNRKHVGTRKIPPTFDEKSGELCSTNGLELHVGLDPLKWTFLEYCISALRGRCALKFLHAWNIDQDYLAHTPAGAGVPPKNFNREH